MQFSERISLFGLRDVLKSPGNVFVEQKASLINQIREASELERQARLRVLSQNLDHFKHLTELELGALLFEARTRALGSEKKREGAVRAHISSQGALIFLCDDPRDCVVLCGNELETNLKSGDVGAQVLLKAQQFQLADGKIFLSLIAIIKDKNSQDRTSKLITHESSHLKLLHQIQTRMVPTLPQPFSTFTSVTSEAITREPRLLDLQKGWREALIKQQELGFSTAWEEVYAYLQDGTPIRSVKQYLFDTSYDALYDKVAPVKWREAICSEINRLGIPFPQLPQEVDVVNEAFNQFFDDWNLAKRHYFRQLSKYFRSLEYLSDLCHKETKQQQTLSDIVRYFDWNQVRAIALRHRAGNSDLWKNAQNLLE